MCLNLYRYHCDLPDEFLFTSFATVTELAKAIKEGKLTSHQQGSFDAVGTIEEKEGKKEGNLVFKGKAAKTTIIEQKEPWCPWFTCCY